MLHCTIVDDVYTTIYPIIYQDISPNSSLPKILKDSILFVFEMPLYVALTTSTAYKALYSAMSI